MKVLWLCNMPIRSVCKELGIAPSFNCGWMDGAFDDVSSDGSIDLTVCYPQSRVACIEESRGSRFLGFGFPWPSNGKGADRVRRTFVSILSASEPDIVHIFGTENEFGEAMADAASSIGMGDRVVVSIQGLVSVICQQFLPDFPESRLKRATISENQEPLLALGSEGELSAQGGEREKAHSLRASCNWADRLG